MRHFALYDANSGFFRWFGAADGIGEAIRFLDKEAGGLHPSGAQRLGVYEGTESQIAAIKLWQCAPSNEFPKEVGPPTIFDATELSFIVKGREFFLPILLRKLGIAAPPQHSQ
jgi:hypothetical protein